MRVITTNPPRTGRSIAKWTHKGDIFHRVLWHGGTVSSIPEDKIARMSYNNSHK